MGDRTVYAAVWQMHVGRTTLYLLDTDTPENESADDRAITSTLYGGNQETRIRQEIVLGIGGVRVLRALGVAPSIYGLNEGHAAFLGLELLGETLDEDDLGAAMERVRRRVVYTNHTVVPAGNDIFPAELVLAYLGRYAAERGIGEDRLLQIAATNTPGQFSMPILAFSLAGKANAVSQIHAEAVEREWPGFPVEVVTNGVHIPTWVGREVRSLLDTYVPGWRGDSPDWAQIHAIPAADLWNARVRQRRRMLEFVASRVPGKRLNPDALTIVWARRFAQYKRADLIVSDLARLERIMSNADRPVQLIISGKAHPADEGGKRIMQGLIRSLEGNPGIAPHVAFVEDYSLGVAQQLTAGADVWLNTPRKPLEASGTSGMKSSDNGGLQLTVRDGWCAEVDWWDVGWGIEGRDDAADAQQMYEFLEDSITPCFYARNGLGVPGRWVSMVQNSMQVSLSRYSTRRMVLEYLYKLYLPLVEQQGAETLVPT
jgi:starch phosphorylase